MTCSDGASQPVRLFHCEPLLAELCNSTASALGPTSFCVARARRIGLANVMGTPPIAANAMHHRADLAAADADILEHAVVEHHQMTRGALALAPGKKRSGAPAYDEPERLHGDVNSRAVDFLRAG